MKKINIQISLDRALDELSILSIKYSITENPQLKEKLAGQILDIETRIAKAIGYKKYQEVIKSVQYSQLYDANYEVFKGVDRAKTDKTMLAYDLDQLNDKRTAAKRNISLKYCGNEGEEIKIRGK